MEFREWKAQPEGAPLDAVEICWPQLSGQGDVNGMTSDQKEEEWKMKGWQGMMKVRKTHQE
jgi:hypothetical protein